MLHIVLGNLSVRVGVSY